MRTAVTEMFGIDLPIFAFSHCRDVVAAVTKAGGMGVLGAAAHSPEQLDIDLAWIEAEVGERPYGVDVIVPLRYVGAEEGGLPIKAVRELIPPEHVAFVDDILRRYEVPDLPDSPAGPTEGGGPPRRAPGGRRRRPHRGPRLRGGGPHRRDRDQGAAARDRRRRRRHAG